MNTVETLTCDKCGAPLEITPEVSARGYGRCAYCDQPFRFEATAQATPEAGPVEKPWDSKIEVEELPGPRVMYKIPPQGFSPVVVPLAFFTFIWCGFMVTWNVLAFRMGWAGLGMAGFGLLHDAVGVFLLYTVFWMLFGRETLTISPEGLEIRQRLFGISTKKSYPFERIDALGKWKKRRRIPRRIPKNEDEMKVLTLRSGTKEVILAHAATPYELEWLEYELKERIRRISGRTLP